MDETKPVEIVIKFARMLANEEQIGLSLEVNGEHIEYLFAINGDEEESEIFKFIKRKYTSGELQYERPDPNDVYQYKAFEIRDRRDSLLEETDKFFTVSDRPIKGNMNLDALKVYRQALRDVPQQEGFPENVVWPTKPEI